MRLDAARTGILIVTLFVAIASGCASKIPKEIREPPPANPMIAEVRGNVQQFIGSRVRWGGTIAGVENHAADTWIEVVGRDLQKNGRPIDDDRSPGRFIAVIKGFLDPVVHAKGRDITVAGEVENEITRKIGDYDYRFPLVVVSDYVLWQPLPQYSPYDYYHPYWYYDPWYPYYYPYPWWHSPYYW